MKIYISTDIEGTTGITHWDETDKQKPDYKEFQKQMTREVQAACEGALQAGATEIWVKDAHWTGRNLLASQLPEDVKLIRGWSGHPFVMAQELDESFDAILFTGYHSRAGSNTSPLAHTMNLDSDYIKINDILASEFHFHALIAAMVGVPVVFLSGDQGICQDAKAFNEHIETVAVNQGIGDSTLSIHPNVAIKNIKEGVQRALEGDLKICKIPLPTSFEVEIRYKDPKKAYRASFYPGARGIDAQTMRFESTDYFDVLRMLLFVLS